MKKLIPFSPCRQRNVKGRKAQNTFHRRIGNDQLPLGIGHHNPVAHTPQDGVHDPGLLTQRLFRSLKRISALPKGLFRLRNSRRLRPDRIFIDP